jgi:hypothetical protein
LEKRERNTMFKEQELADMCVLTHPLKVSYLGDLFELSFAATICRPPTQSSVSHRYKYYHRRFRLLITHRPSINLCF